MPHVARQKSPQDPGLRIREAAGVLGVSPKTVARYIKSGDLPAYRLGPKLIRIRAADLDQLVVRVSTPDREAAS